MNNANILLVEDSAGDIRLVQEALRNGTIHHNLSIVRNGVDAMKFLRREKPWEDAAQPDLILLDLNMPLKDGREVLAELKSDPDLCLIPVIVLTTSSSDEDIRTSYTLHANCYITKPVNFDEFISVMKKIEDFWISVVQLPGAAA